MEGKKKKKKYSNNKKKTSVKSKKKVQKKVQKTNLSNEELVEKIMNKKKGKSTKKSTKNDSNLPSNQQDNKQTVEKRLKEINKQLKENNLSGDALYDLLAEKKKLNKELTKIRNANKQGTGNKPTTHNKTQTSKKPVVKPLPPKEEPKKEEQPKGLIVKPKEEPKEEVFPVVEISPKKNHFTLFSILTLLIGIVLGSFIYLKYIKKVPIETLIPNKEEEIKEDEEAKEQARLLGLYNDCLARPLDEIDRTDFIINAEKELTTYLGKYKTSVGYKDINMGYEYYYNQDKLYYAASSIKALSALYIYEEASKGNIDLDSTLKYTSRHKMGASLEMSKIPLNSEVKIRDLVRYTVVVSDNSAYSMLVSYIGKGKLRNYGKALGAKYTLLGGDNFGSINVSDGLIYWKAINEFMNNNGELGEELRSYFISAEQNELKIPKEGIMAAHKYGEYSPNYHDLGVVYSSNPYYVAILTREFGKNMHKVIQDINNHVYDLHLKYYQNRENICKIEIYGN